MTAAEQDPGVGIAPAPGESPPPALELLGLWKRFGEKIAVAGLTLAVPAGSFYGMVGPNGAGKTTTLSMATGLLRPDAGAVRLLGHDLWADPPAAKRWIGVLPDGVKLFDRLSGRELITYNGLLRGLDRATVADRTGQLLAALGLADAADTLVVDYSAGMTKKVALACALVHGPRLLLLDEPFEAVDPVSAATIRSILHEVVAAGGTVVMSSHVMELVERLCDHVAIVHAGRVVAAGPLDAVRAGSTLEQRFVEAVGAPTTVVDLSWLRS
ncbi:MAG TPA: ATP-binding cassette domain-containing protein [Kineosporiaceae bacterium]